MQQYVSLRPRYDVFYETFLQPHDSHSCRLIFFLGSEHITVPGISSVVPRSIGDKVTRGKMCWTEEGADTEGSPCAIFSTVTPHFGACCVKEGFWPWCNTETVLREALERRITFGLTGNLSFIAANHKLITAVILLSPQFALPKIRLVFFHFYHTLMLFLYPILLGTNVLVPASLLATCTSQTCSITSAQHVWSSWE